MRIKKNLNDLIRANRDRLSLSLATITDVGELIGDIKPGFTAAIMLDWRLIKFSLENDASYFTMVGGIAGGVSRATSKIKRIDFKKGLVMTQNSVYGIGEAGDGEPHRDQLIALCAYMHNSPLMGRYFDVPHFFY